MQNPALLQPMIQQLALTNPQLAQMFAANPDQLMELITHLPLGEGGEGGEAAAQGVPPGTHVLRITEEERAAITRVSLCAELESNVDCLSDRNRAFSYKH